ncbi:hypothetical protein, partial [Mangrovicoccus sp. HB161399]|uniref:hypothetical protein n=1 Tax=Mangrovicoccus sp. HB161399 TaxID=2720392 RepID=UPI001C12FB0E
GLPRVIEACDNRRLHPAPVHLSPAKFAGRPARAMVKTAARQCPPAGAHSSGGTQTALSFSKRRSNGFGTEGWTARRKSVTAV